MIYLDMTRVRVSEHVLVVSSAIRLGVTYANVSEHV